MISDFTLLYGNDEKIDVAAQNAVFVFSSRKDVEAVTITELTNPVCSYLIGTSCQLISTYSAEALESTSFEWSSDVGTLIVDPNDSSKVSLTTDVGVLTTDINLTVVAKGRSKITTTSTILYTHTRIEIPQVTIVGVTQDIAGACIYATGETCLAESTYSVDSPEAIKYLWEINGDAVIVGDTTLSTCIVQSTSDVLVNFTLKVTASDDYSSASVEDTYSHDRTERGPIDITSFQEVAAGCCTHA